MNAASAMTSHPAKQHLFRATAEKHSRHNTEKYRNFRPSFACSPEANTQAHTAPSTASTAI
jgi:hypothetical protein